MNTQDLLTLSLAWAVVSSYGAAYAWTHSPRIIRGISSHLASAGARKVGGIWFARAGRIRFSFCISSK
jgi:hypothetical protein